MSLSTRDATPTAVYRLYDVQDRLLYVGITVDLEQRWSEHSEDKFWWHLVVRKQAAWHQTRGPAVAEEREAIRDEGPLHNRTWPNGSARGDRLPDPFVAPLYAVLRQAIEAGVYPVGSELPTPRALAAERGVSVCSVVGAVWRLHREGLVTQGPMRQPYREPRVRPFLVADFQRAESAAWPVRPVE
jgi:predicted GIY-YIG superfamily endonuclease